MLFHEIFYIKNANSVEKYDAESKAHPETSRKRKRQICDKSEDILKISSSLFSKRKTKKSADQNSKSGSAKNIELQPHELCDVIKKEVDDDNDVVIKKEVDDDNDVVEEFPTGNVLKISSTLFSKSKTRKSADQKSKSFFSGSAETIESQARELRDGIKKEVDDYGIKKEVDDNNNVKEFPKSRLFKKPKRIYKPRPKKLCEICDKVFADSSSFAKHKRVHFKEKPFKCDQCHKSFRQSNDLKRHIRTHTIDQDFPCDLCSSKFNCPDNLKRHKVVHAQEKPFQCRHCSSSFTRLSELKHHTVIHTKKDLFKCQLCDMTFTRASSVKRHMSTHIVKNKSSS